MKKFTKRWLTLFGTTSVVAHLLLTLLTTGLLLTGCKKELMHFKAETEARSVQQAGKQLFTETAFFTKNKDLGGEITVLKSDESTEGSATTKVFHIEAPADGNYYLSAWVNIPALDEQKSRFLPMDITINNEKQEVAFNVQKAGWHSGAYMDGDGNKIILKLKKGTNTIGFFSAPPLTPSVDFVRLTRDRASSDIPSEAYTKYLNGIRAAQSSSKAAPAAASDTLDVNTNTLMSVMSTLSADPDLNEYAYTLGREFKYSFYTKVYLTSGKHMSITSWAGSLTHVLEVFSADNPQSQSWTATSYLVSGSQRGYIPFTVPATGYYYVKLRSYWLSETGMASLNVYAGSGSTPIQYYDCPIAGELGFAHYHNNTQELNYFTSYTTGDPRMWIVDNNGFPGKVCGYNDDYGYHGGDFYWGLNSRVKKNFNRTIQGIIVTTYSSYNPTGTTDLYSGCKNSNLYTAIEHPGGPLAFPNLKVDDAIMSSSATNVYNCTAWTGGLTRGWFWGALYQSQSGPLIGMNYGNPQVWSTWDDYYDNNPERYAGAMTYTADGADATNGVIAMWAKPNGEITHGSIRKPGNNHAHGYDWESKPGGLARTFHPRDALAGNIYGNIVKYYRIDEGSSLAAKQALTFEESLAQGLTVVEPVELSNSERTLIKAHQATFKDGTKTISALYNNWINKITSGKYQAISNPYKLIDNPEGLALLKYGQNNLEEATLYFADVIFSNDNNKAFEQNISYLIFCEMARDKYGYLMEGAKEDWKNNPYTKDRKYTAPLPETFTKKYVKAILTQL